MGKILCETDNPADGIGGLVELLAPARDIGVAREAILAGADAIYIGASAFGARSAAANEVSDISKLCDFAHIFGCRVYVALNTLLTDSELPRAESLAKTLCEVGVDAFIVQDMGLASRLGCLPVPLHASTQCDIRTLEKAKFFDSLGFQTIVLARELSLSQISQIAQNVKSRIECFVHGALCVSYSGCCYLSYAIGGRSGNRGECAQPCRMKYSLVGADGAEISAPAHFLSLRDMNRSANVGEMLDAGVRSFKIEGRLKDAAYVKNITAYYRKILDSEIAARGLVRSSYGDSETAFVPDTAKSFSRGFTEYHLHGTNAGCASFDTPKSRGEFLGVAKKTLKNGFVFSGAANIFHNGDGLLFDSPEGAFPPFGAPVCGVRGDAVFVGRPGGVVNIPRGAGIWRNFDANFSRKLKSLPERKMEVEFEISETEESYEFKMKLCDARAVAAEFSMPKAGIPEAKNSESAREKIAESLCKLGGTNFKSSPDRVHFKCARIPFFKPAQINEARRALVGRIEFCILSDFKIARSCRGTRGAGGGFSASKPFAESMPTDFSANVLNREAEKFYADAGIAVRELAPESGKTGLIGRRVMTAKHCVLRELGMCKKKIAPSFKEPLRLVNGDVELEMKFNCSKCECELFLISSRGAGGSSCKC